MKPKFGCTDLEHQGQYPGTPNLYQPNIIRAIDKMFPKNGNLGKKLKEL